MAHLVPQMRWISRLWSAKRISSCISTTLDAKTLRKFSRTAQKTIWTHLIKRCLYCATSKWMWLQHPLQSGLTCVGTRLGTWTTTISRTFSNHAYLDLSVFRPEMQPAKHNQLKSVKWIRGDLAESFLHILKQVEPQMRRKRALVSRLCERSLWLINSGTLMSSTMKCRPCSQPGFWRMALGINTTRRISQSWTASQNR